MPEITEPPPEARLIASLRERAPRQSIRQAAAKAGISDTRWRQIENGFRYFRGEPYPERGPAVTIARMAGAVGGTPEQLAGAGRPDAAAELAALLREMDTAALSPAQKRLLKDRINHTVNGDDDNPLTRR